MKSNKKLIIVITIVLALAVASGVFAYLFFMTDIFKSNKELFAKYFEQNTNTFEKVMNLQSFQIHKGLENESNYESNTTIKTVYSEGGEISNPLNNLLVKLVVQKNKEQQYMYANTQVLYENEQYLDAEIIKEQGKYGVRFSDIAKKFVAMEEDNNIQSIADDIGIDVNQLQMLIGIIDGREPLNFDYVLKEKYLNIIKTGISNGIFEKQKDALITYNNATTQTNAYSVLLNDEQVKTLLLEIINNLKAETDKEDIINLIDGIIDNIEGQQEIPAIKITVHEQKSQTIRTIFEIGIHKVIIENVEQDGEIKSNIAYLNNNQDEKYNIEIVKANNDNQEKLEIKMNTSDNGTISILNETQLLENEITNNWKIAHEQGITTTAIELENKISKGESFEKIETLVEGNYLLLNTSEGESRKNFLKTYKERVAENIQNQMDVLIQKLMPTNESVENLEDEEQMPQVDINKFNAKFEFYTGDEVSSENVKKLLDIVKNNLSGHSIMTVETEGEEGSSPKTKNIITIYVEKDQMNESSMAKILAEIDDSKKYKVAISYKDANGLIEFITITEI